MPTEDAYSSGHLVLSQFGTCMCSNVETNLSWTCFVSGLLNFEYPSVLLFCLKDSDITFGRGQQLCEVSFLQYSHKHGNAITYTGILTSYALWSWTKKYDPASSSRHILRSWLVRCARCCTSVLDFHSKNLQITSKLLTQGYIYHRLRKTFGKFFRSYSELLPKFGDISFQEYV